MEWVANGGWIQCVANQCATGTSIHTLHHLRVSEHLSTCPECNNVDSLSHSQYFLLLLWTLITHWWINFTLFNICFHRYGQTLLTSLTPLCWWTYQMHSVSEKKSSSQSIQRWMVVSVYPCLFLWCSIYTSVTREGFLGLFSQLNVINCYSNLYILLLW